MFVLRPFKMVANQMKCSRRNSVIQFLVSEKRKPCEIYQRMCYVCGEASFIQKKFINELNMGLPLWA